MPFARNNLECVIGSIDTERTWSREQLNSFVAYWQGLNWLDSRGNSVGDHVIVGGFSHVRVESGFGLQLYSNHQGGYRAMCPRCKQNITSDFSTAVTKWRGGDQRSVFCTVCGHRSKLESVSLRPPGMFADGVLILCAVESIQMTEQAQHSVLERLGQHQMVFRRLA